MADLATKVKTTVYRFVADHATMPTVEQVSARLRTPRPEVLGAYAELAAQRLLVLEPDGDTIRMASPFSGIETQHRVAANCKEYQANCAWDTFGIVAALGTDATIHSRCEQSLEPLVIEAPEGHPIGLDELGHWRFHTPVQASHWWDDIRYT